MPNVPPLDPNWKRPEDPMNPPLPQNAPSNGYATQPPNSYTPKYGSSTSASQPSHGWPNEGAALGARDANGNFFGLSGGSALPVPGQQPQQTSQNPFQGFPKQNIPSQQHGIGMPQQQAYEPGMGPGGAMPAPSQNGLSYQGMKPSTLSPQGTTPNEAYTSAREQLTKAAMNVARDPRFSQEQKAAAFERIKARADELDQGFAAGKDLMTSPTGLDTPPPETFGEIQPVGLTPIGQGALRNPETGDILNTVRAPNGQIIPANLTQSQIDSLPQGTRYMTPEGKMEIAGGPSGSSRSSSTRSVSANGQEQLTQEDAYKQYEKWSKANMPMTTPEEIRIKDLVLNQLMDDSVRKQAEAELAANPDAAAQILTKYAVPGGADVSSELEQARISAFTKDFKSSKERSLKIAKQLGIAPPEEKKPTINPNHYIIQQGSRGTMRIYRRGSALEQGIPAVEGPDGELRPAPTAPRELADLEVNTEFANVRPAPNGLETRVLPFQKQMVNLGNFALSDRQRMAFSKEMQHIAPRSRQEWDQFSNALQQYGVVDEPWDPRNLTPAQQKLQGLVNNFYRELQPEGRAMMTMYIAHSLGHKVDPTRGFTSTGWARTGTPQGATRPASPAPALQNAVKPAMTPMEQLAAYEADRNKKASAFDAQSEKLNMQAKQEATAKAERNRQWQEQQAKETEAFNAEQWRKLHEPDRKYDEAQQARAAAREAEANKAARFQADVQRESEAAAEKSAAPGRQKEALYGRQADERRRIQAEIDKIEASKPGWINDWTGMDAERKKRLTAEADAKIAELKKKQESVYNYVK